MFFGGTICKANQVILTVGCSVVVVQDELRVFVSFDHQQIGSLILADFSGPNVTFLFHMHLVKYVGDGIFVLVVNGRPVLAL